MKNTCFIPVQIRIGTLLAACLFASFFAKAQSPGPNVYFDPNNSGTSTVGGSGDFSTSDFWNGSTDAPFQDGTNAVGNFVPGDGAIFDGAAGTVEVSSAVTADYLEVGVTSGTETFGAAGDEASITLPIGWNPTSGPNYQNPINIDAGSENVVFNSSLNFGLISHVYNPDTLNSATTGNVSFNGGITFTNNSQNADNIGQPNLTLNPSANGSFTINSAVQYVEAAGSSPLTNSNNTPNIILNGTAGSTLTLTSNASFSNVNVVVYAGTVLDQGASYSASLGNNYTISVGGTGQYLTDAANLNVTNNIVFTNGGGTLGDALANTTTFSGQEIVAYNNAPMDLSAVAGGRVNFTGDLHSGQGNAIVKVGAGTVNLNDSQGRGEDQQGAWEVKNGTLLLNATYNSSNAISGSGLEIDNVLTSALVANTQTYATLGGNGGTAIRVTADGANSSITPGDPTVNNGIGTLTLSGGLTAANGLTLNFNFSGATNSMLDLGTTAFTPGGVLTFNLDNVGTQALLLNTPYDVIESGAGTSYSGSSFVFNAPEGYAATGSFDAATDIYSVEFTETPEPSTYALMLGGFAVLGFYLRRKGALLS